MILLLFIGSCIFTLLFFGAIRLLIEKVIQKRAENSIDDSGITTGKKALEIIYFLLLFIIMVLIFHIILYASILLIYSAFSNPYSWGWDNFLKGARITVLFYFFPMLYIAYWLFPFRAVKRNKTMFVILSAPTSLTVIAVAIGTVVEILHAFSNM